MRYTQATLIVGNDPNLPPITTIKSAFDPTIISAHPQPFNLFFTLHRALLLFVTSTAIQKGSKIPFQRNHDVKYGIEVTERDPRTSAVLAALCLFCLEFGRKAKPDAKHQRTNNVQVFKAPFCTNVYNRHHENFHTDKWHIFLACSAEQKAIFFNAAVHNASTLMAHFVKKCALTLAFNRNIVDVIIEDLLFDSDDEVTQSTREKSLVIFKPLEDVAVVVYASDSAAREKDLNREAHIFNIASVCRFKMILGFISMGASFLSAS